MNWKRCSIWYLQCPQVTIKLLQLPAWHISLLRDFSYHCRTGWGPDQRYTSDISAPIARPSRRTQDLRLKPVVHCMNHCVEDVIGRLRSEILPRNHIIRKLTSRSTAACLRPRIREHFKTTWLEPPMELHSWTIVAFNQGSTPKSSHCSYVPWAALPLTLSEKGAEGIPQVPHWHWVDPGGKSVLIVLLLGWCFCCWEFSHHKVPTLCYKWL